MYFGAGSDFSLAVHELLSKLEEELFPYGRDVVVYGVELVQDVSKVADPSGDLLSFNERECDGDFPDGGVESCDFSVDSEVHF